MDETIRAIIPIGLTAVGMLALVGLLFGGSCVLSALSDCSGKERAIVEDYPHYDNRHIATYPWTFSCSIRYTTKASRKEVLGYYDDTLRQNGWEVMGYQTMYIPKGMRESQARGRRLSDLWGLPQSVGGTLVASRDGYSYWVSYEPPNREDPDIPDEKALVMVSANDHPLAVSLSSRHLGSLPYDRRLRPISGPQTIGDVASIRDHQITLEACPSLPRSRP